MHQVQFSDASFRGHGTKCLEAKALALKVLAQTKDLQEQAAHPGDKGDANNQADMQDQLS
jgi:hypothetical protein